MERVAYKFLEHVEIQDEEKDATVHLCKYFDTSCRTLSAKFLDNLGRHTYITPTSYLELIGSFKTLISSKQDSTMKAKKRYVVGLEKLAFAASQVRIFCTAFERYHMVFNNVVDLFYLIKFQIYMSCKVVLSIQHQSLC